MKKRVLAGLVLLSVLVLPAWRANAQSISEARSLAGLGEVWGLLKYFHPDVSDWDDELAVFVPRFKAATSKKAFNQEVVNLIGVAGLSYVFREISVGIPRDAASLGGPFAWIDDSSLFDPTTQLLLKTVVLAHKPANRFVRQSATGNADFTADAGEASGAAYPSEAVRLLALFRFWNMVQYYCPGRDLMDRDWTTRLPELVPLFQAAASATEYNLAVATMTAAINDAHAATSSSTLTSYWGVNSAPVQLRLVEGKTVVTRVYQRLLPAGADLRVGDVVTHINGVPTETMRAAMAPLVNGSNEASLERNIHSNMVRTNASRMTLTIQRDGPPEAPGTPVEMDCPPLASVAAEQPAYNTVLYTILTGNVGYVNMGVLQVSDVPFVMGQLKNTRAIIFDIRNYPNGTLYSISNYLNPALKPFVKFLEPDFHRPGSFVWSPLLQAGPDSPDAWTGSGTATFTYTGKAVVLANQETQSQAEYTVMAFQTAPGAVVIGSQTAGADGNVSLISLPGGISTYFSGLGVYYPDGRVAQRVGIVPDIVSKPTIRGLRDGRDEVLETALQLLR